MDAVTERLARLEERQIAMSDKLSRIEEGVSKAIQYGDANVLQTIQFLSYRIERQERELETINGELAATKSSGEIRWAKLTGIVLGIALAAGGAGAGIARLVG